MSKLVTVTALAGGAWQDSGGGRDWGKEQWKGRDARTRSGGVLRVAQDGEGEDLQVFTFDDPGSMACQTRASFGNNTPDKAIVAYLKAMLKT